MAPNGYMFQDSTQSKQIGIKANKIRKPVIEKMRRDRINSSIEKLRILLEKDIQIHHPHSKLEKADILEMAVTYLQQHRQQQTNDAQYCMTNDQDSYYEGYYLCLKETMGFLHKQNPELYVQSQSLHHLDLEKNGTDSKKCLVRSPKTVFQLRTSYQTSQCPENIWRPW
ncbi:transcription factor HES-5-like [Pelobates fuscus]|uniref:transcription factor HES-5-like n=1 Tax=Pelobates fuscus TaxID=191477 RepID=UPI002FE4E348